MRHSVDGKGDGGGMVWSVDKEKEVGVIGEENLIIIQRGEESGAQWGKSLNSMGGARGTVDRRGSKRGRTAGREVGKKE